MPTVQLRDIITYYEEAGSGEPLLLIAGLGSDSRAWARQLSALTPKFRVITFDNRGSGRSSAPDRPYTIAAMAEDLGGLLDALDIQKAHVVGAGFGATVAQEFAATNPGRVNRLALISATAALDGLSRQVLRSWIDVRRSNMSREAVQRLMATWLYSHDLFADEERFEQAITAGARAPHGQQDHAFIRQATAMLDYAPGDRLKGIKAETLILHGEDDRFLGPQHAEALAGLLPSATIQALPGGHAGPQEFPAEYNEALLAFLNGTEA